MGDQDLHSIAFSSHCPDDNLGRLLNEQTLSSQHYMEKDSMLCNGDYSNAPYYNYWSNCGGEEECNPCSGYLEDVLLELSSKRRRLEFMFTGDVDQQQFRYVSEKNCPIFDFMENFDCNLINPGGISDMTVPDQGAISYASSYEKSTRWTYDDDNLCCTDPATHASGIATDDKIEKKRATTAKVVYPFAVVKPGGFEGDATLNDINERILMPPTRPVRHPVGDFACKPKVVSPQGPGLSGKAVVAFTRLHTQGRGTITIIRTRG